MEDAVLPKLELRYNIVFPIELILHPHELVLAIQPVLSLYLQLCVHLILHLPKLSPLLLKKMLQFTKTISAILLKV